MASSYKKGAFKNGVPFVRVAGGKETLVYFMPLNDAFMDVRSYAGVLAALAKPLLKTHTVWFLGRKRKLPAGYSLGQMTGDYKFALERILEEAATRKCDLIGYSMGGVLALKFAASHPALISRLGILSAAAQLGPGVAEMANSYLPLAEQNRLLPLLLRLVDLTFGPFYRVFFKVLVILLAPVIWLLKPSASDLKVSVEALLGLDLRQDLKKIKSPALVIGGGRDQFFSADGFRETAQKLPNGQLKFFDKGTHALFLEQRKAFDRAVIEFLKR